MKTNSTNSNYALKKAANVEYKKVVTSLAHCVATIEEMYHEGNEQVIAWYQNIGLSPRPKNKKNWRLEEVYLSPEMVYEGWVLKNESGAPCRRVKGQLKEIKNFTFWTVATECKKIQDARNKAFKEQAKKLVEKKRAIKKAA